MKRLIMALLMAFISSVSADSTKPKGFGYLCVQGGDSVFVTVPAIDWDGGAGKLEPEYRGDSLFTEVVLPDHRRQRVFRPIPALEVIVWLDDFEGEVSLDRVRFLAAGGKLYSWIGLTGTRVDGIVGVEKAIRLSGEEKARGRKFQIEVRHDTYGCQS